MSAGSTDKPASEYRLPTNVKPSHYDLTVRTDLDSSVFDGVVKINLDVKMPTSKIVLNSNGLKLDKAYVRSDASKDALVASDYSVDEKDKRVTFTFPTTFNAGSKLELKIGFTGELDDGMVGYYRSSYEKDGQKKYYSLTQFEAVDARRAFPCWDEPALKATFDITLVSKVDTVSISNSAAISEETFSANKESHLALKEAFPSLDGQWKITKFQTTPIMSTYLVAFANGPFEYIESTVKLPISNKTVPLRVYATADLIHQAQFALDVKAKVLPLYEQIFDVPYPLPKLDTLVASAMENWGLITGRTNSFLLDPKKADMAGKKRVIVVQSHEVAHMWFGNITTMEWWDYLYLNEGFATLMGEVITIGKVFPEFKANSEFIDDHLNRALALDAKLSSHPIEVSCPNADSIGQIFDALSYSKAASVLRMLSAYVGEDKFLKGVSIYLKNHMYGNSVTNDLWKGISESTGLDIPKLMDNWINKMGFPVVTVTETSNGIKVRQDRFLETGIAQSKDNETLWCVIPLSILTVDSNGKPTVDRTAILDTREKEFPLDASKPFKINAGTNGVYCVLYTSKRLSKIATEVAKPNSVFSLEDRMGLINDSFSLSKAALMKLSSALTLVDAMQQEEEYLVWNGIAGNLGGVAAVWRDNAEVYDLLNEFRRSLFGPIVKKLGYEYSASDSPDTTQLRTCAIGMCAVAEDMTVVNELKSRFDHYMKTGDDSRIPADLQRTIYRVAVKHGGRDEYNAVKAIFEKPPTPTARIAAMFVFNSRQTQDDELLKETFNVTLRGARDQDVIYFFRGLGINHKSKMMLVDFFKQNYDELCRRFQNTFMLKYFVEDAFGNLSTEKDLQDTIEYFKDKDVTRYEMSLNQTLDGIRARIAYLKHSTSDIETWLKEWKKKNSSAL
ncbi:leucyl aminopeptidase [Dendrothele bispora CBS 962.96]|uniref:Aminopeptidase n=1 Tax=Dendrothele bispora (strain CBS 962.96) TaxID=1314807 RepID=A0A4V4HIN9_DENBC|nr:leucyl aminopeptidase [Dendrothele bispora CBS 962.96]